MGTISYESLNESHSKFMCGSLGIFDDLINFWEECLENKVADGGHLEKWPPNKLVGMISYEPLDGSHSNCIGWFSEYF